MLRYSYPQPNPHKLLVRKRPSLSNPYPTLEDGAASNRNRVRWVSLLKDAMATAQNKAIPGTDVTPEQILGVCRTNVEALHNLKFLINENVADPEAVASYLEMMDKHLQNMTDELCRKL